MYIRKLVASLNVTSKKRSRVKSLPASETQDNTCETAPLDRTESPKKENKNGGLFVREMCSRTTQHQTWIAKMDKKHGVHRRWVKFQKFTTASNFRTVRAPFDGRPASWLCDVLVSCASAAVWVRAGGFGSRSGDATCCTNRFRVTQF